MTIAAAIADLQTKALSLSGVKAAPASPPEAMSQFPFAVCYARSGTLRQTSAGWATYLHTLICEIHVARQMLPRAVEQAMPYIELFAAKLIADPTLGGTVSTVVAVRYLFGRLSWGSEEHLGVQLEVEVKLMQS